MFPTMPDINPYILAGEIGSISFCSLQAVIAVAYVMSRNPTFYGYSDTYDSSIAYIADNYYRFYDYSYGGYYVFSGEDIKTQRVQTIIKDKKLLAQYKCKKGLQLYIY